MDPYLFLGQCFSVWYFYLVFVIFPLLGFWERLIYDAFIFRFVKITFKPKKLKKKEVIKQPKYDLFAKRKEYTYKDPDWLNLSYYPLLKHKVIIF